MTELLQQAFDRASELLKFSRMSLRVSYLRSWTRNGAAMSYSVSQSRTTFWIGWRTTP